MVQELSIQQTTGMNGALTSEHYQTFEMAKENDAVLGGDDIAQIRSYAAYARAQAQAIHKTIAATNGIDDVAAIKQEALETEQTFAKVGLYADQRIGEILRGMEQAKRGPRVNSDTSEKTKADAIAEAGIPKSQAYDLQKLAANPDVVQAVLDKAEAEGRVASRKQVLDAIHERKLAEQYRTQAEQERDKAKRDLADAYRASELMEAQVASLKRQVAEKPKPQIVEREVTREVAPPDYESIKHERDIYLSDVQRMRKRNEDMRKELEKAKLIIGEKQRDDSAQWDIAALTTATNNYLRQYGGKAWAFDQFYRVDEVTQAEFTKAINNLAAFAQNLAQIIREQSNE